MRKVVVVSASWCGQCGPYKKALEQAGIEFEVCDADAPENEALLTKLGVRGLPTTIIYVDGAVAVTLAGAQVKKLQELLSV